MVTRSSTIPKPKPLSEEWLTVPEIAFLTGFERGTVERWRLRYNSRRGEPVFLEPDDYVGSTPVWRLNRLETWCEASNRPCNVESWRAHKAADGFRRKADA